MDFTIRVEWRRQDGTTATAEMVTQDQDACKSACRFSLIRFFLNFGAGTWLIVHLINSTDAIAGKSRRLWSNRPHCTCTSSPKLGITLPDAAISDFNSSLLTVRSPFANASLLLCIPEEPTPFVSNAVFQAPANTPQPF